jgi:hypothetical protein
VRLAPARLAACAVLLGLAAGPASAQAAVPVRVSIDALHPGHPVPREFLGLSFEAGALPQMSRYARKGNLVALLRSLGPGVIRFGGITADQNAAWTDAQTPQPAWSTVAITPAEIQAVAVLARRSGWRVLLTVGLAHYEPVAAAREVAVASRALGHYLAAVEIGNEPDYYGKHGLRELPWLAQGYSEQASAYREAIAALTPGVPIAGPDVSGSGIFTDWGEAEALTQAPVMLTGHHYPLGCAQIPPPSIATLLSPATRALESRSLANYTRVGLADGIPVRVDEANSVSCGGVPGISNTFASALWATGYLTTVMSSGAVGINLQGNPSNCLGYTPVCAPGADALAAGRLRAQPDWYALLLTSALVGYRPLPSTVESSASPNLLVAPFSGPGHSLRLVLVDYEPPGSPPLAVRLTVGSGRGAGSVLRLTAPSQTSTGGVALGGRGVDPRGDWRQPAGGRVRVRSGLLWVRLPASSAALVSLPAGGPPGSRARGH